MPGPARAGALIYARHLPQLAAFYQQLLGMQLLHGDAEHQVLANADFQLIVHAMPPHIAANVHIDTPPQPRSEQAIKLFFTVPSLADAAQLAAAQGGALYREHYQGPGFTVCNGHDPEGNIFHLRENHAAQASQEPTCN
ncbi:VOC family protein [Vogesella mureinivorans]|uniref:VOC family protein n=1 Tax=Vogesella mureinivorans TaxID=657276 RepID=UPI0011C7FC5C|nr:VOC family protein [Vogesella mureinivorans]